METELKLALTAADVARMREHPLLAEPATARAMGERARRAAQAADAGLDRLWSNLTPLLPAGRGS